VRVFVSGSVPPRVWYVRARVCRGGGYGLCHSFYCGRGQISQWAPVVTRHSVALPPPSPGELMTPAKRTAPEAAFSTKKRKGRSSVSSSGGAGMARVVMTAAVAAAAVVPSSFTSAAAQGRGRTGCCLSDGA